MNRTSPLLAALFIACGCSPAPVPPPFLGDNNSAVLTGPAVGTSANAIATLRKPLTVSVAGPSATLPAARAFALRPSSTTESTYLVVEVSNAGTTPLCFISYKELEVRDSAGLTLKLRQGGFVQGSVGQLGSRSKPILTDTCLAARERGLILDIALATSGEQVFTRAESIVFRWDTATESEPAMPAPKLTPTAYSVTSAGAVNVAFTNTGSGEALMVGHFSRFVLLDPEGLPLFWGFIRDKTSPSGGRIPAGGEGSVEEGTTSGYGGAATRLRAILDFDVPPANALQGDGPEPSGSDTDRLAAWNAEQRRRQVR